MSKSISKMNKKELYELCKTLQEDLHKESYLMMKLSN